MTCGANSFRDRPSTSYSAQHGTLSPGKYILCNGYVTKNKDSTAEKLTNQIYEDIDEDISNNLLFTLKNIMHIIIS